jgi:hypothetical protein
MSTLEGTEFDVRDGATLGTQVWVPFNARGALDPSKLEPVKPQVYSFWKPREGGLWTAQWDEQHGGGWIQWCMGEQFGVPHDGKWDVWTLTPKPDARVLVIDTYEDLQRVYARWPEAKLGSGYVAWHGIGEQFDGVHLTEAGQYRTRFSDPSLYGWDCESTFWYRWAFAEIAHVGPRTFVEREQ